MKEKTLIVNYSVAKYNFQNIHSTGPELYVDNPCIGYVNKGCAEFLYNGKTITANEGDLIYIGAGTKYRSIWFGSPDIEFYSVNFKFKHQYDFCEYQFQILKNYQRNLFDKMYEFFDTAYLRSVSYFYQLLDDVYKKLVPVAEHIPNTTVKPAIEYIENNYNQGICVGTLAKLCKCSESGLFKMFKKSTGVTPVAYKHNIMIQHSLELLSHTNLSIEEISARVGFSSSNYFRTVFFKLTGKTPKELR
ncbi:MAG: helix-turn-helix domain-containing protein [Clostridia bacterium]|nr:helix-turn-helix domain-containing protein [Clostridia bacterium]